jgi:hypothetical protein
MKVVHQLFTVMLLDCGLPSLLAPLLYMWYSGLSLIFDNNAIRHYSSSI